MLAGIGSTLYYKIIVEIKPKHHGNHQQQKKDIDPG